MTERAKSRQIQKRPKRRRKESTERTHRQQQPQLQQTWHHQDTQSPKSHNFGKSFWGPHYNEFYRRTKQKQKTAEI